MSDASRVGAALAPEAVVAIFPGSNCDSETVRALTRAGFRAHGVWHTDLARGATLYVLPGGFTYGDYLRPGAIAAHSPALRVLREAVDEDGALALGICNGFQILTEAGFLPGSLEPNRPTGFRCRPVTLCPKRAHGPFARALGTSTVNWPIAHSTGRYVVSEAVRRELWREGRVLAVYADPDDPNGSVDRIAAISDETGRIAGFMPHPERAADPRLGARDGLRFFERLLRECEEPQSTSPSEPREVSRHVG